MGFGISEIRDIGNSGYWEFGILGFGILYVSGNGPVRKIGNSGYWDSGNGPVQEIGIREIGFGKMSIRENGFRENVQQLYLRCEVHDC